MPRIIPAFTQFFAFNTVTGVLEPLVDGWLAFYESGTTSTDKDTFSDLAETTANTNPVQLDAEGRCPSIFGTGAYKVVSYTNDEVLNQPAVTIQTFDPVPGGTESAGPFSIWYSTITYEKNAIVTGSNGLYYTSQIEDNTGNDPVTDDGSNWIQALRDSNEVVQDLGTRTTATAVDITDGNVVTFTVGGNFTLSFTGWYTDLKYQDILIKGTNMGAYTITWPTINWVLGDGSTTTTFANTGIVLQTSGVDFVFIWTVNNGTTLYGKVLR